MAEKIVQIKFSYRPPRIDAPDFIYGIDVVTKSGHQAELVDSCCLRGKLDLLNEDIRSRLDALDSLMENLYDAWKDLLRAKEKINHISEKVHDLRRQWLPRRVL
jgi:hypothetical protein